MLVISRGKGERVQLALPDGTIAWVSFGGLDRDGKARLGFEAPRSVRIRREELIGRPEPVGPCGKVVHETEEEVRRIILNLRAKGQTRETRAVRLEPYRCSRCGGWHLGHRDRRPVRTRDAAG